MNITEIAIMLPIQPRWCELIAAGKKTYELRKSAPSKISCMYPSPVTVYIYQSKHRWTYSIYDAIADWQGKVIGKFTLKQTTPVLKTTIEKVINDEFVDDEDMEVINGSCVPPKEILNYIKNSERVVGWKIDDLEMFNEPKNLSDFYTDYCECFDIENNFCYGFDVEGCCIYRKLFNTGTIENCVTRLTKAPQNYCFVKKSY